MSTCIICSNECFRDLSMSNSAMLTQIARELIQGMTSTMKDSLKDFRPKTRGTCMVERCARFVEQACRSCRKADCQRCAIAAELRAGEMQLNASRDAELMGLGVRSSDLEGIVDHMIENLCADHSAFGPVLMGQWYTRRNFMVEETAVDAPQDT